MLQKPAQLIYYSSSLQKPAAGAIFCNVLKYKADTFYLSMIQKTVPGLFHFLCNSHLKENEIMWHSWLLRLTAY